MTWPFFLGGGVGSCKVGCSKTARNRFELLGLTFLCSFMNPLEFSIGNPVNVCDSVRCFYRRKNRIICWSINILSQKSTCCSVLLWKS